MIINKTIESNPIAPSSTQININAVMIIIGFTMKTEYQAYKVVIVGLSTFI